VEEGGKTHESSVANSVSWMSGCEEVGGHSKTKKKGLTGILSLGARNDLVRFAKIVDSALRPPPTEIFLPSLFWTHGKLFLRGDFPQNYLCRAACPNCTVLRSPTPNTSWLFNLFLLHAVCETQQQLCRDLCYVIKCIVLKDNNCEGKTMHMACSYLCGTLENIILLIGSRAIVHVIIQTMRGK
jgi:hypothetical protein